MYVPENWFSKTIFYSVSTHLPTWVSPSSVRHDAPVSVEPLPQPTLATRAPEGAHQPGEAGGPGRPTPAETPPARHRRNQDGWDAHQDLK